MFSQSESGVLPSLFRRSRLAELQLGVFPTFLLPHGYYLPVFLKWQGFGRKFQKYIFETNMIWTETH